MGLANDSVKFAVPDGSRVLRRVSQKMIAAYFFARVNRLFSAARVIPSKPAATV